MFCSLNTDAITHSSAVRGLKGDTLPLDLKASIEHRGLPVHTCVNERALISWLLSKLYTHCCAIGGSLERDVSALFQARSALLILMWWWLTTSTGSCSMCYCTAAML